MKRAWGLLIVGAVLMIAGVAGLVEMGSHVPGYQHGACGDPPWEADPIHHCSGWTTSTYNDVHIAGIGLLIIGGILVSVGLIRTWRVSSQI